MGTGRSTQNPSPPQNPSSGKEFWRTSEGYRTDVEPYNIIISLQEKLLRPTFHGKNITPARSDANLHVFDANATDHEAVGRCHVRPETRP